MNLDLTPNPPTGGVKAGQIGMREPTRVSMAPGQHRPEQGRGSSRAQERAPDRAPGRNPRPLERGAALPLGRAQPARRHRHPLEYRSSRRGGQTTETRRADRRARAPGPHLTPGVGPHPAHRRIPVAKTPITALAYDPAPYRSRPHPGGLPGEGSCRSCPRPPGSQSAQCDSRGRGVRCGPFGSHQVFRGQPHPSQRVAG